MTILPKLLYLGFAFPPGVSGLFPEAQPAGHLVETGLVNSLRPWFEIRSVGISWIRVEEVPPGDPSPGLPHALNLLEAKPEPLHRLLSLRRLKRQYRAWLKEGWLPEVILVCNLSPVYNGFLRWLKRWPGAPPVVLYLADSMNLQHEFPWLRRLRHRFKPLVWPDSEMVRFVDACVAVSLGTRQFFRPVICHGSGCQTGVNPSVQSAPGPIQFQARSDSATSAPWPGTPACRTFFACSNRGHGRLSCTFVGLAKRKPRLPKSAESIPN